MVKLPPDLLETPEGRYQFVHWLSGRLIDSCSNDHGDSGIVDFNKEHFEEGHKQTKKTLDLPFTKYFLFGFMFHVMSQFSMVETTQDDTKAKVLVFTEFDVPNQVHLQTLWRRVFFSFIITFNSCNCFSKNQKTKKLFSRKFCDQIEYGLKVGLDPFEGSGSSDLVSLFLHASLLIAEDDGALEQDKKKEYQKKVFECLAFEAERDKSAEGV
jgi:hypothetical protein